MPANAGEGWKAL